ncbi:hypothetical protein [Nannocystis pusilla]|uniref:hypothetical protein n=1 Tax=Nannocystis pusilla TaxID=889268 RepID=UPI003DA48CF8
MEARCADPRTALELAEPDGSILHINFDHERGQVFLELVDRYPEVGVVSRVSIVDDAGAEPPEAELSVAVELWVVELPALVALSLVVEEPHAIDLRPTTHR